MKHDWAELIPELKGKCAYITYFCRKCGKFASNYPGNQYSWEVECDK